MTDEQDQTRTDPLVVGVKRAAMHLGKAGLELFAAFGELSKGVVAKVRPPDEDDDASSGPQRVPVD